MITIDFETRSGADLKKGGTWLYSRHPSTDILCLAWKRQGEDAQIIIPGEGDPSFLLHADELHAHNAFFEYSIWNNVGVRKYGWPPLPQEKLRCSAAVAASYALPRSLGEACRALGLPQQKDKEGGKLMRRLCRPRKTTPGQGELFTCEWHEDPDDLQRLYDYARQDVVAEEGLTTRLGGLSAKELQVWRLDQQINLRGIPIDLEGAQAMSDFAEAHEARLLKRLETRTLGKVRTAKQVEVLRRYLGGVCGLWLPDLSAATVAEALAKGCTPKVREILEIRQSLARSSAAKYQTMLRSADTDGRVRDCLLYHGAATGRWSGKGVQPQNFPSRIKISAPAEEMLQAIKAGGLTWFDSLYPDDPMAVAGAVLRSVICAPEGREFIAADYSAIEGRGLAWAAGEQSELEVYRSGKDVYVAAAAKILGKPYADVTPAERQSPGKISVLACGYGGSVGAVRKFGGADLTDDEIKEQIVNPWREAHPRTVCFWRDVEEAAKEAVRQPGSVTSCRAFQFSVRDGFLKVLLPSGRKLHYYDPIIQPETTSWGEVRPTLTYMSINALTKKWERTNTYGGKLVENLIQAICRDIMAEAMLRVEAAGYTLVFTVHDELIAEVPEGWGSVEELCEIMSRVPSWATGFPIAAAGWRGRRYRK